MADVSVPRDELRQNWLGFGAAHVQVLTRVLLNVVREMSHQLPPPRGVFYRGLDHPAGEFGPFESLAARGIFRKYESVLLLGAGLGGAARWCHAHFGCDVTGVDRSPAIVAAAAQLSARAGLASHTQFVAARWSALPLRSRSFTHVWAVDCLDDGDANGVREGFRCVRLGGLVAVQRSGGSAEWADSIRHALVSAGFAEVEVAEVERPPLRDASRRARERLMSALRSEPSAVAAEAAARLERVYAAWPLEGGTVRQVFGRRLS